MEKVIEDRFRVVYAIEAHSYEEAKAIAFAIQVEQTVECPYEYLKNNWLRENIVGQLENLEAVSPNRYEATISYASDLTANEVTQFLNVVFGNSSLQPHIWVKDVCLSPSLWQFFKGPRWGIEGLRRYLSTPKRSLLQAVIKPIGTPIKELAAMCKAYATGGVDVIKDDHGITNQRYATFQERVKACVEATMEGRQISGHKTLYAANVSGDAHSTIERAYLAKELGAHAVMVAPALVGFSTMHALASDPDFGLPIISHPAFAGGFTMAGLSGVTMKVWFGLFNRICGADMPIFVSYGGRFTFSKEQCCEIIGTILDTRMPVKRGCPSPGGGVSEARLPELIHAYGNDVMYLVGGDMFRRGPDLVENSKSFIALLEEQTGK